MIKFAIAPSNYYFLKFSCHLKDSRAVNSPVFDLLLFLYLFLCATKTSALDDTTQRGVLRGTFQIGATRHDLSVMPIILRPSGHHVHSFLELARYKTDSLLK